MTTDVHFVKNNPFILNDYRYNSNSRLPTSASSIHIPSNYRSQTSLQTDSPVLQSASCSNIQKTVVSSNRFEDFSTAAVNSQGQAPPIPHSVFRRFRLVSEMEQDSSTPTTPTAMSISTATQNRQNYSTMHSSSISSITTAAAATKVSVEGDWYNRGRLEHSQSHGAISHLQQPLKLQVDEYNNNNNNNEDEMKTDEDGKSYIEYGPGIVQKLREKFSKMASSVIETAQISPHAKQKKFPSVDDILSENEQRNGEHKRQGFNDQTQQEQPKPYYYFHHDTKSRQQHHHELPSSPPLPSRSQSQPPPKSPPLPSTVEQPREPQPQSQESPRAVVEKTPLGPISALRAKFEQQAAARAHAFGIARQNFGSRSQSVNTLKQCEARKEAAAIPKSTESLIHAYKQQPAPGGAEMEEIRFAPKIPEKRPSGFLPAPIPQPQEQQILKNYSENKRETNYFGAPKPVRVMDLISPPADPAPKEYHLNDRVLSTSTTTNTSTNIPPTVHSPASSTASSDRSPPPEEPRLIHEEPEQPEEVENENDSFKESYEQYRTQAIQDDRSNERLAFAAIQRQKMTLTLPIGSPSQHHQQHHQHFQQPFHQRSLPQIGKPGSTPITGPTKLKLPSDNSGISEMQKLLNKFNAIREQKMHETPTHEEEKLPTTLPTAIVPPVVQQQQQKYQQQQVHSYSPNIYHDTIDDWKIDEKKQQNIISISIGEQQQQHFQHHQQGFDYLERDDTTPSHHHHKQRMAPPPPPPPPLPPRGGTDQQQQQRKSLTSRWLESKQDSDDEGIAQGNKQSESAEERSSTTNNTVITMSTNFGVGSHSKPYGDNEIVDEQTRRSLETMSVVKEEPEEETEEIGTVRLLSRRTLEDDNGTVHRSDFLKSNYPYDSSESEEEEHPNAHLAAYGIHRLGIYEAPNASDGNPVRHSLLNLVAEEDIPELLQAMAEECHFVFDDCDRTNMPTTSGIIHTPAKRMERRKQRNVDRICFDEKLPEVFAYVDESAAYEEGEWSEGFPISYEEYKQIVESANQETAQQHMDLANWRMLMEQKFSLQDEQIRALTEQQQQQQQHDQQNTENQSTSSSSSSGTSKQQRDEELGVTSTYSYSTTTTSTPSLLNQCSQPLQIRQTSDRETSAM